MREAVRAEVIQRLKEPLTYRELAEEMGTSYHTCRRYVQTLVDEGVVVELSQRSPEGHIRFMVNVDGGALDEPLKLKFGDKLISIPQLIAGYKNFDTSSTIAEPLAFLVSRSRWMELNQGKPPAHPDRRFEGYLYPMEVKVHLREAMKELKKLTSALEQFILHDEMWEDTGKLWDRAGAEDLLPKIEAMAEVERARQSDNIKAHHSQQS